MPLFNLRALLCGTHQYFLEAEYILVMECVLVITTKDILQLLPINGRPPMTSAHMISSYHRLNLYFLGTLGDSSNRIVDQDQQCQRNRLHSQCQPKIRVGRHMTSRHCSHPLYLHQHYYQNHCRFLPSANFWRYQQRCMLKSC